MVWPFGLFLLCSSDAKLKRPCFVGYFLSIEGSESCSTAVFAGWKLLKNIREKPIVPSQRPTGRDCSAAQGSRRFFRRQGPSGETVRSPRRPPACAGKLPKVALRFACISLFTVFSLQERRFRFRRRGTFAADSATLRLSMAGFVGNHPSLSEHLWTRQKPLQPDRHMGRVGCRTTMGPEHERMELYFSTFTPSPRKVE